MTVNFTQKEMEERPTECSLLNDELLYEALEAQRAAQSCSLCTHYIEDYNALKEGWGICMMQTDDSEVVFTEEDDSCSDWERV